MTDTISQVAGDGFWHGPTTAPQFASGDFTYGDNEVLRFGDLDTTGDCNLSWNGTNLVLLPAVDDTGSFIVGNGTLDFDLKWFGGTTAKFLLADVGNARVQLAALNLYFTGAPGSHPIHFDGVTLPANSNLIRGTSLTPTRVSGWISLSGTVSDGTLANVYSDYRELHTAGTDQVLGIGSFPFMDSGASCASMFAGQFICQADSGATITTAGGAEGTGVFPIFAKCLINSATANSGAVMAAIWASVQANVTSIASHRSDIMHMEVASGAINALFYLKCTGGAGATYLFSFADDLGQPVSLTNGSTLNDISATANAGWIRVVVGSTVRYLPLYAEKA